MEEKLLKWVVAMFGYMSKVITLRIKDPTAKASEEPPPPPPPGHPG